MTNPHDEPVHIGTRSIIGSLKLRNWCDPWFATQTNYLDWAMTPESTCFAAKEETNQQPEREIGFTEIRRENLPDIFPERPNYIDKRYKAKTSQKLNDENRELKE